MRTSTPALWIVLGLAAAAPAAAERLWTREWIEVRTQHFVVASSLPEERSRELAVGLEDFRAGASLLTNIGLFEERIPTKVYVLPHAVRDLGFDNDIAGYFDAGMRANYAVMIQSGAESDEVLKHEYVHFLVHNRDRQLYPPWIDEGFADVLSTLSVKNGVLEYGKPLAWRISSLNRGSWMSFSSLLAVRGTESLGRDRGDMFYAQSWFLMHYLMIGRKEARFDERATDYLRRVEAGEAHAQAFEAAFEIKPAHLQATLVRYGNRIQYYRARPTEPLPGVDPQVRRMGPDEVAAELGLLASRRGNGEAAQRYFDGALAANPNNALALVGVGDLHRDAKRYAEAVPLYERAVALEPENANHELDYGEYFLTRASLTKEPEERRAFLVEARRHFARSYKLNPDNPETLDQNGLTYLFEGEDAAKALESLELAHELLPSETSIRSDLARACIAAGQPERARTQLRQLLAWSHSSEVEWIQKQLASLGPDPNAGAGTDLPEVPEE